MLAASLVQQLVDACKSAVEVELVVHVKQKAEDGGEQMGKILEALKDTGDSPLIGVLAKVGHPSQDSRRD